MARTHWKTRSGPATEHFFATQAAGLAWIRVPGGPPVPEVVALSRDRIGIEWIPEGPATHGAAQSLGRQLAALHATGAPAFGSAPSDAPPGATGWIGDLPMRYASRAAFREFLALDRIAATARMARDRGGLTPRQTVEADRFVESILAGAVDVGPDEPPARLHGDLWSGNLLWGREGPVVWLIDPAAHGGHRESDLAMLALFGAPFLEPILAGYEQVQPLAPGWRGRVALHQVWPLLVHAALFSGGYGDSAMSAIRQALE